MAPTLTELALADPPERWAALGFALDGSACRVGAVTLRLGDGAHGAGITGWTIEGARGELGGARGERVDGRGERVDGRGEQVDGSGEHVDGRGEQVYGRGEHVDGLALRAAAGPRPPASSAHPNGALAVDHVVVGTPDHARTVAALEALGLELRLLRPGPQGRIYAFLRAGEAVIEVIGPPAPEGSGPATFWGVAFALADLDGTAAALGEQLVRPPRDAVQPGRRIATVRRAAGLSTRVAFMTPRG